MATKTSTKTATRTRERDDLRNSELGQIMRTRRTNALNPAQEINAALDEIAAKVKGIALLLAEYATNFTGGNKAEMDAAAYSMRGMFCNVVSIKAKVEINEAARI